MPHPKNRLKLTGDTHPPEVEYDLLDEDDETDEPRYEPQSVSRRFNESAGIDLTSNSAAMRRPASAAIPYRAIFLTLATVYVLGKLLRR
jgi:hypothetical protein